MNKWGKKRKVLEVVGDTWPALVGIQYKWKAGQLLVPGSLLCGK